MLLQLLCLVLLVGFTAAALLRGLTAWGQRRRGAGWRMPFGASYGLCVLLLLPVVAAYLRLSGLGVTAPHTTDLSFLFQSTPLYARLLLGVELPAWARLLAALPVALPAAAVARALSLAGQRG